MKIYIDVNDVREYVHDALNARKISDPKTDIGYSFNDGIEVAFMTVDAYLVRLNGYAYAYQEDSSDD